MDFSKLKLDVYDFLGLILPGLIAVTEGWILLRGSDAFVTSVSHISGVALTFLLILSFGVGHLAQEFGDIAIQWIKGKRYLRAARDRFWSGDEAKIIKHAIKTESGHEITTADGAYNYCLTKLKGHFAKRDAFIATSDLCRSLIVLSLLAVAPAVRLAFFDISPRLRSVEVFIGALAVFSAVAALAWRRMVRFREFADVTVFIAYLGVVKKHEPPPAMQEASGRND